MLFLTCSPQRGGIYVLKFKAQRKAKYFCVYHLLWGAAGIKSSKIIADISLETLKTTVRNVLEWGKLSRIICIFKLLLRNMGRQSITKYIHTCTLTHVFSTEVLILLSLSPSSMTSLASNTLSNSTTLIQFPLENTAV